MQAVTEHADAWPFKEPVDAREVPDYYDIIKDPIGTKITALLHIIFGFPRTGLTTETSMLLIQI